MKFGCHISIRNGYLGAAKQAKAMNAQAFQYFPKNPRGLSVKDFNLNDAQLCKKFFEKNDIESVAHTPYPTDLTAVDGAKRKRVVESLINDLHIAEACGSLGVVVHFGKLVDVHEPLKSYQLIIEMLDEVLMDFEGNCKILLENNAGKPGTIGTTLEELVQVRKLSERPNQIGFCLDTCHAFASGLWNGRNWAEVLDKGTKLGYFNHLMVIHFNNSAYPTESGKDRHANILGPGYITESQFNELIHTPQLKRVPFILETPKENITHQEELKLLKLKWG